MLVFIKCMKNLNRIFLFYSIAHKRLFENMYFLLTCILEQEFLIYIIFPFMLFENFNICCLTPMVVSLKKKKGGGVRSKQ